MTGGEAAANQIPGRCSSFDSVDFALSAEQRELAEAATAFAQVLPRTSTGKVDRAGLAREQHELEPAGDGRRNKR